MDMGLNNMQEIQKLRQDVISSVHGIEQEMQRTRTSIEALVDSAQGLPIAAEQSTGPLSDRLHTLSEQVWALVSKSRAGILEQTILRIPARSLKNELRSGIDCSCSLDHKFI